MSRKHRPTTRGHVPISWASRSFRQSLTSRWRYNRWRSGPGERTPRSCISMFRGRSSWPERRPRTRFAKDGVDLEHYYRSKHLKLVVTIDVTNGLARESEAPALVAAHRSITDPAVQRLYRNYVRALVEMLHPDYLGLAAETNLIRQIAPRPVYNAVVRMTNDAASDIRRSRSASATSSLRQRTGRNRVGKARPTGRVRGNRSGSARFPLRQSPRPVIISVPRRIQGSRSDSARLLHASKRLASATPHGGRRRMAVCFRARNVLVVAGNAVEIHHATVPASRRGESNRRLPAVLHRSGPWEFPEAGARDFASLRDAGSRRCEPQAEAGTCHLGQDFRATTPALSSVGHWPVPDVGSAKSSVREVDRQPNGQPDEQSDPGRERES